MSGQGLAKKLLFPAYAEAGANDTFSATVGATNTVNESASTVSSSHDLQSEATTALLDNRSLALRDTPAHIPNSKQKPEPAETDNEALTDKQPRANFFPSTAPSNATIEPTTATTMETTPSREKATLQRPFPTTSPRKRNPDSNASLLEPNGSDGAFNINNTTSPLKNANAGDGNTVSYGDYRNDYEDATSLDRDGSESDIMSDVLSTASEFGTVINLSARYADLDAMAAMATPDPIYEEELEHMPQDDPVQMGLSLPMLLERPSVIGRHSSVMAVVDETPGTGDNEPESPADGSGSAAAMVSAAFRRLGNGVGALGRSGNYSAPSTPRVEDYLKSAYRPNAAAGDAPSSLLLRSPGSLAHQKLKARLSESRPVISPRFARARGLPSDLPSAAVGHHPSTTTSPLRFAAGCLSFESALDDRPTIPESLSFDGTMKLAPKGHRLKEILSSRSFETQPVQSKNTSQKNAEAESPAKAPSRAIDKILSPIGDSSERALSLATPQRVEIEREDALDILACLVDRSLTFEEEAVSHEVVASMSASGVNGEASKCEDRPKATIVAAGVKTIDEDRSSTFADVESQHDQRLYTPPHSSTPEKSIGVDSAAFSTEMSDAIKQLQAASRFQGKDHSTRMNTLDQLLRSHVYACEMKRAAQSASSWLQSIGRLNKKVNDRRVMARKANVACDHSAGESEGTNEKFEEKVEKLMLEAMLHSAELKAREKEDEVSRINTELTKCRAEIGRLKSVSNVEVPFMSPNCSVLDNDSQDSDDSNRQSVLNESTGSPIINTRDARESPATIAAEATALSAALVEANATITKLYLTQYPSASERDIPRVHPTLPITSVGRGDSSSKADIGHMVTPWQRDFFLPAPPTHSLRSAKVSEILQEWTLDPAMHESLLSWLESALSGADPQDIPPLTIANLSQHVKDGLMADVLPLLEQRSNITVDIRTRTQRKTTFDISVCVDAGLKPPFPDQRLEKRSHTSDGFFAMASHNSPSAPESEVGAVSVAHSAATAHVSNSSKPFPHFPRQGEVPMDPGINETDVASLDNPTGLIGAISSFGGLLARNRPPSSQPQSPGMYGQIEQPANLSPGHSREESQPYQRVLSCPPGRIGLTFVQYKGHAMVSDVSPESPLSGWVFPSDILIAIDEVLVSGMRVREIVKLLTARKDRQRALRVISSHAMNEITLNTSVDHAL